MFLIWAQIRMIFEILVVRFLCALPRYFSATGRIETGSKNCSQGLKQSVEPIEYNSRYPESGDQLNRSICGW